MLTDVSDPWHYSQTVCCSDINAAHSSVFLFVCLFPYREQRGVQETGAVNHIHRHGDQPPGNPVHGPLLPQQVRGQTHRNMRAYILYCRYTSNPQCFHVDLFKWTVWNAARLIVTGLHSYWWMTTFGWIAEGFVVTLPQQSQSDNPIGFKQTQ